MNLNNCRRLPKVWRASRSCECAEKDPWSTQVYHRAPKGKETKQKPKQEFKK